VNSALGTLWSLGHYVIIIAQDGALKKNQLG
jgi:hypothetical protein